MTIDGCHLNAFSAKGLAGLIETRITPAGDASLTPSGGDTPCSVRKR